MPDLFVKVRNVAQSVSWRTGLAMVRSASYRLFATDKLVMASAHISVIQHTIGQKFEPNTDSQRRIRLWGVQ